MTITYLEEYRNIVANIKLNLNIIEQFINKNNLSEKISQSEIKNIFEEANQFLEDGTKGKDEYLTNNEVPTFQRLLREKCSSLSKYYGRLLGSIQVNDNGNINLVECNKTQAEIEQYKNNLKEAKDIIEKNSEQLGLTEEELNYIKNASTVVESYGSARYDKESDELLFNLNDGISVPDIGSIVKVLIHEATHASIKSQRDSKKEERQCETRALNLAYQLYKEGKINNFEIMQNSRIDIKSLDNQKKINSFVEMWLNMSYKDYPEE